MPHCTEGCPGKAVSVTEPGAIFQEQCWLPVMAPLWVWIAIVVFTVRTFY